MNLAASGTQLKRQIVNIIPKTEAISVRYSLVKQIVAAAKRVFHCHSRITRKSLAEEKRQRQGPR